MVKGRSIRGANLEETVCEIRAEIRWDRANEKDKTPLIDQQEQNVQQIHSCEFSKLIVCGLYMWKIQGKIFSPSKRVPVRLLGMAKLRIISSNFFS